jgi:hypothetical protein
MPGATIVSSPNLQLPCTMESIDHLPGEPAPHTGRYDELNVFGAHTGLSIQAERGERLPVLPHGFSWRHVPRGVLIAKKVAVLRTAPKRLQPFWRRNDIGRSDLRSAGSPQRSERNVQCCKGNREAP